MKQILLIAAVICATGTLLAQAPRATPRPGAGGPRSDLVNDTAIRKIFAELTAAWNKHDTHAMARIWTIDGDHMEPDGRHAKGRDEVERLFVEEHASVFKDSHITLNVNTVWFITADVALVDGSYELTGVRDQEGNILPPRRGHLSSVLLKERSQWRVVASRAMLPVPLVWREEGGS